MKDKSLFNITLSLADDALVLGHRLSEWCGQAHSHEEDLALANIGLDLIGQSRALYAYAAEIEGANRDEDTLCFHRDESEYKNLLLCELPNGDFAFTIFRLFTYSVFMQAYWRALVSSGAPHLAALATRADKEVAYHVKHAASWMLRLGQGTPESQRRLANAALQLQPWLSELFDMDEDETGLASKGLVPDRGALRAGFDDALFAMMAEAGLPQAKVDFHQKGGRIGRHTEHLGYLLGEMQVLARRHPDARW